jgi:hypothetical protein
MRDGNPHTFSRGESLNRSSVLNRLNQSYLQRIIYKSDTSVSFVFMHGFLGDELIELNSQLISRERLTLGCRQEYPGIFARSRLYLKSIKQYCMTKNKHKYQLLDWKFGRRCYRHLLLVLLSGIFFNIQSGHSQVNTFPYNEGFENEGSLPEGWSASIIQGPYSWLTLSNAPFANPRSGSYMARYESPYFGDMSRLITPTLDFSSTTQPQLSFYYINIGLYEGEIDQMQLYYSADDGITWNTLGGVISGLHVAWTKLTFQLPSPSSTYKIAFESYSNRGYGFCLDDVLIRQTPSCIEPVISTPAISSNAVYLELDQWGQIPEWEIEYGEAPFTPTGIPNITSITTPGTLISDLSPSTEYTVYARYNCGGGDVSQWVGPLTFTTACPPLTVFPYYEAFEPYEDNMLDCWTSVDGNSATWFVGSGTFWSTGVMAHSGAFNAVLASTIIGDYAIYASPIFDLSGMQHGAQLRFWYANPEYYNYQVQDYLQDQMFVMYSTDGGITSNFLTDTYDYSVNQWNEISIELPEISDNFRIYFVGFGGGGLVIDDFSIERIEICPQPTDLTFTPNGWTSGTVSWSPPSEQSIDEYEYVVSTSNTTPLSGTPTTETSVEIEGLEIGTLYYLFVRSNCDTDGFSYWQGPYVFPGGACIPEYENGTEYGDLISHFEILGTTLSNYSGEDEEGPSYTFYTPSSYTEPNFTAELQAGSTYIVSVSVSDESNQNISVWIDFNANGIFEESERVGYTTSSISEYSTATFPISLTCHPTPGTYVMRVRDVYSEDGNELDPCDEYGYGETEDYIITILPAPTCSAPSQGYVSTVTHYSATLNWTAGCEEESWDVHLTTPGSGAPSGVASHVDVTTPLVISATSQTEYEFWVRASCYEDSYSVWSGPFSFRTAPVNDECANATALTLGVSYNGTTLGATQSIDPSECGGNSDDDVWFSFVAPVNPIIIKTEGFDGVIELRTGECVGTAIVCVDHGGSSDYLVSTSLTEDETYFIRYYSYYDQYDAGDFTILVKEAQTATNDECEDAIELNYGELVYASTVGATESLSAGDCYGESDDDVWFSFVASANATKITTDGLYAIVELRDGGCDGEYVMCAELYNYPDIVLATGLTEGATYYIRFYTVGDEFSVGEFTILLEDIIPLVNDDCEGAIALTINHAYSATTVNATESFGGWCADGADDDVWFSFVAPESPVAISTAGLYGVIELWAGGCDGTLIDCAEQSSLSDALSDIALNSGETYHIRYYTYSFGPFESGNFNIIVSSSQIPPPSNDEPSAASPNIFNSLNTYPNCVEIHGTTAGATSSVDPLYSDVWYRFTAQTNGVSIRLESATMDGALAIFDADMEMVEPEDANLNAGGTEILNYGGLIPGNQYFLMVGNYVDDGALDGAFTICLQHLKRPVCNSASSTLCSYYTSSNHTAHSTTYNFLDSNDDSHVYTTSNSQVQLSHPTLGLRYNETYQLSLTSNYRLEDEELIQISSLSSCSVTIADHNAVVVKDNQRCTTGAQLVRTAVLMHQVTSGSVCSATGYRVEFTPVANCNGDAPNAGGSFERTISAPNTAINLNYAFNHLPEASNPNLGYWSVRWRPRFAGYEGTYGQAYVIAVKKTTGAPAMELENTQQPIAAVSNMSDISANVYPNPNNGELVNLNITGLTGTDVYVRIMDSMGREVFTNRYTAEGSLNTIINFTQPLAQGLYMVEFRDGDRVEIQRMMVTK